MSELPNCPRCKCTSFEEVMPQESPIFPLTFIVCGQCKAVVGVLDTHIINNILEDKINSIIEKLKKK